MIIETKMHGRAKAFVYKGNTDELVYESPYTDNLILNNGLNFCMDNGGVYQEGEFSVGEGSTKNSIFAGWPNGAIVYGGARPYYAIGTGTSPNSYASTICATPVSASQTGNIITLTDLFSPLQVFDVLKYDDGTSTFITSAGPDGLQFVSRKNLNKTDQHFTIWNTSRTTLDAQISSSNTDPVDTPPIHVYSPLAGVVSATWYTQFPINFSSPYYITEVGACTGNADTTAMATRVTFLNAPIEVKTNERVIVKYDYICEMPLLSASTLGYSYTSGASANIAGWPGCSGSFTFYNVITSDLFLTSSNDNDAVVGGMFGGYANNFSDHSLPMIGCFTDGRKKACTFRHTARASNHPTSYPGPSGLLGGDDYIFLNPDPNNYYNFSLHRKGGFLPATAIYIPNSFEKKTTTVFQTDLFDSNQIKTIAWFDRCQCMRSGTNTGYNNGNSTVLAFIFDDPQTKNALQRLTVNLYTRISRDL